MGSFAPIRPCYRRCGKVTESIQDELKQFNIENVTIQPGVYPKEMNTGVKPGNNADGILELVNMQAGNKWVGKKTLIMLLSKQILLWV